MLKFSDRVQCSSECDGVNEVNLFYSRCSVPSEGSALYPVNAPSERAAHMLTLYEAA